MQCNEIWELVDLLKGFKPINYNGYLRPRNILKNNWLLQNKTAAKGYAAIGNDYSKTFLPISSKDSLRIIMTLVSHFNWELHQMDMKQFF